MTIEETAENSALILHAKVKEIRGNYYIRSSEGKENVYNQVVLEVKEVLAGNADMVIKQSFVTTQLGGVYMGTKYVYTGAAKFTAGSEVIVFLDAYGNLLSQNYCLFTAQGDNEGNKYFINAYNQKYDMKQLLTIITDIKNKP